MTDHRIVKRMTILLIALTLFFAFAAATHASLELTEEAYEVQVNQIQRWPLGEGGSLVVRPCGGCEIQTLRVTGETKYSAGLNKKRKIIDLNRLLRMKSRIRNDTPHIILVFFDPENRQVTRLILATDF